jgi:hypothetical protein
MRRREFMVGKTCIRLPLLLDRTCLSLTPTPKARSTQPSQVWNSGGPTQF